MPIQAKDFLKDQIKIWAIASVVTAIIFGIVYYAFAVGGETFYVRSVAGEYGAEDGSSYEAAFDGWTDIAWDTDQDDDAGEVGPGDTLYFCDTWQFGTAYSANLTIPAGAGGTSSNPLVIRGDLASHAGVNIGARVQSWAGTTDNGDGTRWFTTTTTANDKVWVNDPTDAPAGGDPTVDTTARALLCYTASQAACAALPGSFFFDNPADRIYINPGVYTITNVYFNAEFQGINLGAADYITIKNLSLYGGAANFGCVTLARDVTGASDAIGIIVEECEMGFCQMGIAKLGQDDNSTDITIRNNDFHNCQTGTYPAYVGGKMSTNTNWTINGNTFWQEAEYHRNILHWNCGLNDKHAIGFMNMDGANIYGNYVYNWTGYGVSMFCSVNDGNYTRNINIYNNLFLNLDKNAFENIGIVNSFSNGLNQSANNQGHEYHDNIFINIQSNADTATYPQTGAAMRPKYSGEMSGGSSIASGRPKIYNNAAYDCGYLIWCQRDTTASELSTNQFEAKNNISYQLNPYVENVSGYHIYCSAGADLINIDCDHNIFYPDAPFRYSSENANLAAWRTASGGDGNSLAEDPLFADATPDSAADLIIDSASPARNAGTTVSDASRTIDHFGNAMVQAWDIGVYEIQTPMASSGGAWRSLLLSLGGLATQ